MEALENWGNEHFVLETAEMTLQANAKALGGVQAVAETIDVLTDYANFKDMESSDD
jgi:hypothetical protein